ncbi:monovalent cation:proton antiporter-2 (CPA2) family protein [Palleronia sp. KMU-117]|uniref:monovalent cation:proton antiporter-2 (CPA2) family protein n=1 Tax=Palleronia sp. KMU-117 TaxID=3434108 RepID=UPI003D75DEFF
METILIEATIYLAAAVFAVPIATRLGLGSVLGYLLAGIAIGPLVNLAGSDTEDIQHFAEFGVVMMLFLIGLELTPRKLWDMRDKLLGLGGLQIVLTMLAIMGFGLWLGYPWQTALAIGMIFSLSSTAIVLQTLNEKRLMQTPGGRASFSVLLTQDVAVIPMLAILPLLALSRPGRTPAPEAHGGAAGEAGGAAELAISFMQSLPAWAVTLSTVLAVVLIVLFGQYASRPLFQFVHMARLRELYTAFALLIVCLIAASMILVGLSPALGTFLAGVALANSEFRHQLESDLEPFKGLLLGLFFMTVGAGISFATLLSNPGGLIGATLAIMLIKGLILYGLAVLFRVQGRDRWLFTLGLAQAGEFGFVLVAFGLQQSVLPTVLAERALFVIALSMLLTPLFFIAYDLLSRRLADAGETPEADAIDDQQPIIIAGIGRFGQVVNRLVQMAGFRTIVLDNDLATIQLMRRFGFKGFFGDPTRPELLHAAGLAKAQVLVVALDDRAAAVRLVSYARRERPDLHIVARAHDRIHSYELRRAGANDVVREMFDSSLRAGRYVLENMGLSEAEAASMERFFYRKDREALRELADLWQPGVPVADNPAYIARSKELNAELEAALVASLDPGTPERDGPAKPAAEANEGEAPPEHETRRRAGRDGVS